MIDQKNGLIAEMVFNASNKGFFNRENPDYLTANIYKVTPAFLDAFHNSKRTLSPAKDDKNKLLTSITGEWNGKLIEGAETLIDFEKYFPLELAHYPYSLESNSLSRPDAASLVKGDMVRGQEEK